MQADDEFTLLIYGHYELVVIANRKRPCWNREPVYMDSWAAMLWFTAPEPPASWLNDKQQELQQLPLGL